MLLLCSRQAGKSALAGALAVRTALAKPRALVLLLSRSERQAGELFADKVLPLYGALGRPAGVAKESALQLTLGNGSRIVTLPGKEETIRVYSGVDLLVIDEAARVPDALYKSVRPMLAVSRGRLIALSSAYAKVGWFYEAFTGSRPWHRTKITAEQCPRISPEFLAEEREELGERWWLMEYFCVFGELVDAVFRQEDIDAALSDEVRPWG